MHNIYGITIIYIILNVLPLISPAPITDDLSHKSIYDLLVGYSTSKCPYLKTTKLLEPSPTFLTKCSNYSSLKAIKSLTSETKYDVLCLLYANNYLGLCNSLGNDSKAINDGIIDGIATYYNLSNTCQGLSESKLNDDFKDAEGILSNFKTPRICDALCKEPLDNSLLPICNLAAVSLNITGRIRRASVKLPESQGPKVDQANANSVIKEGVSSIAKANDAVNTGGQPVNDHKDVGNKVPSQKKPEVSQSIDQPPEPAIPPVGNKAELPVPQHNVQGPPAHINNAGDVTAVKANKAPATDAVGKEVQEESPVAEIPDLKPPGNKEENQNKEQEEKVIQTPSVIQPKLVETDQKESITTSTETIAAAVQDGNFMESDLNEDPGEMRGTDQSSDPIKLEEDGDDDDTVQQEPQKSVDIVKPQAKPQETDEDVLNPQFNSNSDEEDSFFFIYFMMVCAVFILGYIGYHNKQKVLALVIEGRRGRRGSRRGRPNSANYHKLDSNLEEAVTSACNKNTTNIIY